MYAVPASRQNPVCVTFLLDQSQSMLDPIGGASTPKAIVLAEVVNNAIYELILRTIKDPHEGPRHYYDIGIIGYGDTAKSLLGDETLKSCVDLAANPLRVTESTSPAGGVVRTPQFIDPEGAGETAMCSAIDLCGRTLSRWISDPKHEKCFPPIVINVTDGGATDGDPSLWSRRLSQLATTDGGVLVFNVSLTSALVEPTYFPALGDEMPDKFSEQLLEMSSALPAFMADAARSQGLPVSEGSRGFVCNADITALVTALQIGTASAVSVLR